MGAPIPVEKAEEIILEYIRLRYLLLRGEIAKLALPLKQKAQELGFGPAAAWRLIRYARSVGMIEGRKRLGGY